MQNENITIVTREEENMTVVLVHFKGSAVSPALLLGFSNKTHWTEGEPSLHKRLSHLHEPHCQW